MFGKVYFKLGLTTPVRGAIVNLKGKNASNSVTGAYDAQSLGLRGRRFYRKPSCQAIEEGRILGSRYRPGAAFFLADGG
jgi:hypothetical protein